MFKGWTPLLPSEIELCTANLPGREARSDEASFEDFESLISVLIPRMLAYIDRPFAVFGHSLGGLVGFETARELRQQYGLEPDRLFVSACSPPGAKGSRAFPHVLGEFQLQDQLRHLNGIDEELWKDADYIDSITPLLKSDLAVYESYRYRTEPPLGCAITVYGGTRDDTVLPEAVQEWKRETLGGFSSQMFEGGHFFISSCQQIFLRSLSRDLLAIPSSDGSW